MIDQNNEIENIYDKFIQSIHSLHLSCFESKPLITNPKHPLVYHIAYIEKLMQSYSNPIKLRQDIKEYLKLLPFFQKQFGDLKLFYKGLIEIINKPEYRERSLLMTHINDLSLAKRKADETSELLRQYALQTNGLQKKIRKYVDEIEYYRKELETKSDLLYKREEQLTLLEEKLNIVNMCLNKNENGLYREFIRLHQRMDGMEFTNKALHEQLKQLTEEKTALQIQKDQYKQLYEETIAKLKMLQEEKVTAQYSKSLPSSKFFFRK